MHMADVIELFNASRSGRPCSSTEEALEFGADAAWRGIAVGQQQPVEVLLVEQAPERIAQAGRDLFGIVAEQVVGDEGQVAVVVAHDRVGEREEAVAGGDVQRVSSGHSTPTSTSNSAPSNWCRPASWQRIGQSYWAAWRRWWRLVSTTNRGAPGSSPSGGIGSMSTPGAAT
jgi:hypothetical protein